MTTKRVLTINSHEAWVHQLGYLPVALDIVDGAPGRYCASWDTRVRPVPANATLRRVEEVLAEQARGGQPYDCIVAHSVTDLLDLKTIDAPRVLMLHVTLEGRARNEGRAEAPPGYAQMVRDYLDAVGGHAVATSLLKAKSWSVDADVVPFAVDIDSYPEHDGTLAMGVRVSNQITSRKDYLYWEFHERAFRDVPMRIIGHNPDMPGVTPSESWDDLKSHLSRHRFFVHTAHPELEDGYNMATLEAMAAGLPVLSNLHPSSLVVHGENGFASNDPAELASCAKRLLEDPGLARSLGQSAKASARARFAMSRFVGEFSQSMAVAGRKWQEHKQVEQKRSVSR
jgi:glycosyltransferase involved in cell wall biosynthesis